MVKDIFYKNEGRYITHYGYEENAIALGRNGVMKAIGVVLTVGGNDGAVRLEPINSRHHVGRCYIDIPNDEETVKALCKALMDSIKPKGD